MHNLLFIIDFQQMVLKQLKSIKLHLMRLDEQISSLRGRSSDKNKSDSETDEIDIFEHFPLNDENIMHTVEEKLKADKAYKNKLVNNLLIYICILFRGTFDIFK